MKELLKMIDEKMSHLMWSLAINGVVLLILAVLVFWSDLLARLLLSLVILVITYSYFYAAYKIHSIRKHLKK